MGIVNINIECLILIAQCLIDSQEAECEVGLRVLLIGGGGDTDTFIGHGGGSGFIKLQEVKKEMKK